MKKFLTTSLLVAIFLGGILGPLGVKFVRAELQQGVGGGSTSQIEEAGSTGAPAANGGTKDGLTACSFSLKFSLKACIAEAGNVTMSLAALALRMTGYLFDTSLDYSLNLGKLSQLTVVDTAWGVGRDVANIIFIFILLYIAIATILQVEGFNTKKLLTNVILVALLINFSLVITKVVIDTSNILAVSFYNQMTNQGKSPISDQYMKGLQLQTIYDAGEKNNATLKEAGGQEATYGQIVAITVFGSIFILVVAFVFFAGATMFLIRTIVLIFLMILSPIAFLASILPGTSQYAKKWWNMLFDQSFFAPAFLFLNMVVILVIRGGGISLQGVDASSASVGTVGGSFSAALSNAQSSSLGVIFNFAVLIGMTIASLVIAKSMGAYGAETMIKWGQASRKWGQGFVGRHTIGRAASVVAESETARKVLGALPGGRYVAQGLNVVSSASFGGTKGGYTSAVKQTAERQAKYAEYLGKGAGGEARQASYIKNLEGGAFKKNLATYTGIGLSGQMAVKMFQKNAAKQSAKKNKETELAKLEDEQKKIEEIPKEKDETRMKELKIERTLTTNPGKLANITDEMAEIAKRKERYMTVMNKINDLHGQLEIAEKIDKLSEDIGKKGEPDTSDKGKPSK